MITLIVLLPVSSAKTAPRQSFPLVSTEPALNWSESIGYEMPPKVRVMLTDWEQGKALCVVKKLKDQFLLSQEARREGKTGDAPVPALPIQINRLRIRNLSVDRIDSSSGHSNERRSSVDDDLVFGDAEVGTADGDGIEGDLRVAGRVSWGEGQRERGEVTYRPVPLRNDRNPVDATRVGRGVDTTDGEGTAGSGVGGSGGESVGPKGETSELACEARRERREWGKERKERRKNALESESENLLRQGSIVGQTLDERHCLTTRNLLPSQSQNPTDSPINDIIQRRARRENLVRLRVIGDADRVLDQTPTPRSGTVRDGEG
jgi:hypothetical protein